MTRSKPTCAGCAHGTRRYRGGRPVIWCERYQVTPTEACIDHKPKRRAMAAAIDFLRQAGSR